MENEKKDFNLKRNEDDDGWYYNYEDLKELCNILNKKTPYEYSTQELDDLLNILFEKGIIK